MSRNVYVANIPYTTTEEDLVDVFEEYGTVDNATIIYDKDTGRSRGFAFIKFARAEFGNQAIESLHNTEFSGRTIVVRPAYNRLSNQSRKNY